MRLAGVSCREGKKAGEYVLVNETGQLVRFWWKRDNELGFDFLLTDGKYGEWPYMQGQVLGIMAAMGFATYKNFMYGAMQSVLHPATGSAANFIREMELCDYQTSK